MRDILAHPPLQLKYFLDGCLNRRHVRLIFDVLMQLVIQIAQALKDRAILLKNGSRELGGRFTDWCMRRGKCVLQPIETGLGFVAKRTAHHRLPARTWVREVDCHPIDADFGVHVDDQALVRLIDFKVGDFVSEGIDVLDQVLAFWRDQNRVLQQLLARFATWREP